MRYVLPKAVVALLAMALIASPGWAQDSEKHQDFEGSVEVLYRGVNQDGSQQKYNEDFDGLESGLRLANLQAFWTNLDSGVADYFRIDASGLGGDPYERTSLSLGRRDAYDLKLNHSRQSYIYDLFEFAGDTDGSTWDVTRAITDIDLTLHATKHIDFFVEFRENRRQGSSLVVKNVSTDLFRMETPLDQDSQRYTVGGKFEMGPVDLVFRQSLRRYDNSFNNTTTGDAGLDTADAVALADYDWRQNDEGDVDLTTLSLATPLGDRVHLSVTAFGTMLGEEEFTSDVVLDSSGTNGSGAAFAVNGGYSRTDLEVEHLAIDADLSFELSPTLDFLVQFTKLDRELEGKQLRDLDANGVIDDTEGTVFDSTPGSTTREDYSMESITGLFDYAPMKALRVRAGYRTIDRELTRSGFEYGTNENRNDNFKSDGDETLVLGVVVRPVDWLDLNADYEEGDVAQAFTSVSPRETDRLRIRARVRPVEDLRIDATHTAYENTNRGADFRGTASCTPGGDIDDGCWNSSVEGTSDSITLWHKPYAGFDYQVRWAQQDVDSIIRVRFDTELFFGSAENGDSIYDVNSTQWSGQANVRWGGNWKAFVRGQYNDADGNNSLIGPAYTNTLLIGQDYLDMEFGITHTLKSGVYVGSRLRHFEYGDDARRQFAYDGDMFTLVAGLTF